MMAKPGPIIIAHRANLDGPGSGDNRPDAIRHALELGYDVEVDVWHNGHYLLTGHDRPTHPLPPDVVLHDHRIWWHCKNRQAAELLLAHNANAFWHQQDDLAITSHGHLWCHVAKPQPGPRSVLLLLERRAIAKYVSNLKVSFCHAVCTDYPRTLRDALS